MRDEAGRDEDGGGGGRERRADEVRRQKAEGRRQKAEGRLQKAEVGRRVVQWSSGDERRDRGFEGSSERTGDWDLEL